MEMRRRTALEREKAELIAILQELEKRCQVVVNRDVSAVLKDVPSWKSQPGSDEVRKQPRFRGGIRTWQESKRQLEKKARAGSEKLKRRTQEIEQVMSGTFGALHAASAAPPQDSGNSSNSESRQSSETNEEKSDGSA
jgi:hypothetical protein